MKLKGAIFDLDGTLLDTMPYWENLGRDYLKEKGHCPPDDINEILKTMSLDQSARYFKEEYAVSGGEAEIIQEILELIENRYRFTVPLKASVLPLLNRLYEGNVRMCVATAAGYELAKAALERLGVARYFEFIFTCSEAGVGKDNPEFFLQALERLQTPKSETIVFEDALHAIKSAKAAGLTVAAVYDQSSHGEQEEIKSIADYYLHSFDDWKVTA